MGPKTEELLSVLEQLAIVLEGDEHDHWGRWMRKPRARLLDSDYSGITYLMSAYGGLGSINDLILGQRDETNPLSWKPGHVELNEKFEWLRGEAARLADEIRRAQ